MSITTACSFQRPARILNLSRAQMMPVAPSPPFEIPAGRPVLPSRSSSASSWTNRAAVQNGRARRISDKSNATVLRQRRCRTTSRFAKSSTNSSSYSGSSSASWALDRSAACVDFFGSSQRQDESKRVWTRERGGPSKGPFLASVAADGRV